MITFFDKVVCERGTVKHTAYDYTHQAWVEDGKYVRCGHSIPCLCYGRIHEGEPVGKDAQLHPSEGPQTKSRNKLALYLRKLPRGIFSYHRESNEA